MNKATLVGIILFPIFILLFSFTALVFDEGYTVDLLNEHSKDFNSIGATKQLLQYFQGNEEMPSQFNEEEAQHMNDVKKLINDFILVFYLAAIIFSFSLFVGNVRVILRNGSIVLFVLVILALTLPFDSVFTQFHQMFFSGRWQFPADSLIISYYPAAFFAAYLKDILLSSIMLSIIAFFVSRTGLLSNK